MLILQQYRNTALSIKIQAAQNHTKLTDTSKLTIGHFIALQKEETPAPPARTLMKASLIRNFDKPLFQLHPQVATSTIQRNHKPPEYRKVTLNTAI